MAAAPKYEPTIDELVATLRHSSLPTLIIEGKDDLIIFKRLEEQSENLTLSILPVGGRARVLALFERLPEIKSQSTIAFVADSDLWVFSGIPAEYQSKYLIFTDGYSIENDAFRDADCEKFLLGNEKQAFLDEAIEFAKWYALAVSRKPGDDAAIAMHPNRLLDDADERTRLNTLAEGEVYPSALYDQIVADYRKFLRGKSLFDLFQRRMTGSRAVRHNRKALLEFAAVTPGPNISRLFTSATHLLT